MSPLSLDKGCTDKKWLDEDDWNTFCLETDEWWKSQFPQEDQDQFPDVKCRSLSGNPSPPIFKGLTFYRYDSFVMPREEFKGFIECAGGNLLVKKNPPKAGGNFLIPNPQYTVSFLIPKRNHSLSPIPNTLYRCIRLYQE